MKICAICGSEIEENSVLCPNCEKRLVHGRKSKPKKKIVKKIKLYIMVISYVLLFVFLIIFFLISSACFKSNDFRCYSTSLLSLIIFSCFCFIAAVLVGEEKMPEQTKIA
ncbi:MAG: hypothetical protein ACW98X_14890 [Promethearchaeota archaeon]|jgi:predicted nucleic acid-binding Zn ribbon protein